MNCASEINSANCYDEFNKFNECILNVIEKTHTYAKS